MRIITVLFLTCIGVIAQELPPIQSFSSDIYKGGNQNWDITQDDNRNMYFANNDGCYDLMVIIGNFFPLQINLF